MPAVFMGEIKMTTLLLAVIYLAFISLGLPDALLGSAWPAMRVDLAAPLSGAGMLALLISACTVVSSLLSDRLTRRFGTGRLVTLSVIVSALSLLGFSLSRSFAVLFLLAVPYGLAAGCIDAALNNYVALHYASRHMSWLHCMWGVGTIVGPQVMGAALAGGMPWQRGYMTVSMIQGCIALVMLSSMSLWKIHKSQNAAADGGRALSLRETLSIPGAKSVMLMFLFYCAAEQSALLWGSSYLAGHVGMAADRAASMGSLFCIGITVGRAVSGFVTMKLEDDTMIRLGLGIMLAAAAMMLLPLGETAAVCGLVLFGVGCAPIYPCTIHATPGRFGEENSQALVGVQMASAYVGTCLAPPLFGVLAQWIGVSILPLYLIAPTAAMLLLHGKISRRNIT